MDDRNVQYPPVDIEQWLDFVIAAAAHRSRDEAQRKFGELLINRYFVTLRDEYKDDPVAKAYLDNMLCAVASAIRGFSVVRDVFATNWETIKEAKGREKARAERLDAFAPFKKDGYWKPAVAVISALGLLGPILAGFQQIIGNLPWILVVALAVSILVVLISMELFVDWLRNRRLTRVEERFPEHLYEFWQEKSLKGYRMVLRQFLLLAIKIREEFYPNLTTLDQRKVFENYPVPHIDCGMSRKIDRQSDLQELEEHLAAIVEQHFAFKLKEEKAE
ncbi:MAG: hypothetical protein DRI26_09540 [Chloroflexi bacterium]|nr:MAG: hypothetical protein DRI26_09540 [Chloroflexota bacterium]